MESFFSFLLSFLFSSFTHMPSDYSNSTAIAYQFQSDSHIHTSYPHFEIIEDMVSQELSKYDVSFSDISAGNDNTLYINYNNNEAIPDRRHLQDILDSIPRPELKFEDCDGNILLDTSDIKDVYLQHGNISGLGNEYYIELDFTAEGAKLFSDATENVAAKTDGYNYITVFLDNEIISQAVVHEKIQNSSCIISGNFTNEYASYLFGLFSYALHHPSYTVIN